MGSDAIARSLARRRYARTVIAIAALVAATFGPILIGGAGASAHGMLPGIRVVIDQMSRSLPGVRITTRTIIGEQLVVENSTSTPLEVLDEWGQPFLRIGPNGVDGSLSSPSWYQSNSAFHNASPPAGVVPGSPPRWLRVSDRPQWDWFEVRAHAREDAATLVLASHNLRLEGWQVPMRYGDEPVVVQGHDEYRPGAGTFQASIDDSSQLAGLAIQALPGALPTLSARLLDAHGTVTIEGAGGEPFAKLDGDGATVNEASTTWRLQASTNSAPLTAALGPSVPPRWRLVDHSAQLIWLDLRLAYLPGDPPAAVARQRVPATMQRWEIPLTANGTPFLLRGRTTWIPAPVPASSTGHSVPAWVLAGVGLTLGALAVAGIWRLVWVPPLRRSPGRTR